ncbi:Gamma interferon inducible lysosomal thiol reductase GILT [Sesbania bispinosa]|nr:Gamma interferon inducible lysosomal thiol reductase GILT [Sesbania bispinosa]
MASSSLFKFFHFIPMLMIIMNPSHSSELNYANDKVDVSLYYETLCPDSENFIVNELGNLFKSELMSIINLHLVPYGNARITDKGIVECQAGLLKDENSTIIWNSCCKQLRLDSRIIEHCLSAHGVQLIMRNGNETYRLYPPLTYVPWVLVQNLVHHVCNAYKGHQKFKACKGKVVTTSTDKINSTQAMCHANEGGVSIIMVLINVEL